MNVLNSVTLFGFIASALVHLSTFFGINLQRIFPLVWALHLIIFVVVGLMVFSRQYNRKLSWKPAPSWMKNMCMILIFYTFFNFSFTLFVLSEGGGPNIVDGNKVLQNRDGIIRQLADDEYETQQIYQLRAFSGHWLLFYSGSMALLYPKDK